MNSHPSLLLIVHGAEVERHCAELLRYLAEKKARMGVHECVTHKLIEPFQVLYDKEGAHVAQYKFTVLLMPNGPHKITGLPFDESLCKSEKSVTDEEILKLLKTSANPKAAKKKKKAAEKAVGEETSAVPTLVEQ